MTFNSKSHLIIVPTFNEIENISDFIKEFLKLDISLLVVDDNSPDGTGNYVENIMKNQRLGNWSVGQTKALFVYDEEQYDRERNEIDKDMLIELELNKNSDVIRENRDMYNFDALEQIDIADRINTEVYALNNVAEDDDMGDDDDQFRLDYGDL